MRSTHNFGSTNQPEVWYPYSSSLPSLSPISPATLRIWTYVLLRWTRHGTNFPAYFVLDINNILQTLDDFSTLIDVVLPHHIKQNTEISFKEFGLISNHSQQLVVYELFHTWYGNWRRRSTNWYRRLSCVQCYYSWEIFVCLYILAKLTGCVFIYVKVMYYYVQKFRYT